MNQNYLKFVVPIVLILPVAFLFFMLRSRSRLPENHPLMKIYEFTVKGAKSVPMTRRHRSDFGSEASFMRAKLFNNPAEYSTMPLAQKRGTFLGEIPKTTNEVCLSADFSIRSARGKTLYKLINTGRGTPAKLVLIPITQLSAMGALKNPVNWLKPKHFGISGTFPYYFPARFNTPYGTITYRAYVSNDNKKLNPLLEKYMRSRGMKLLD